MTERERLLKVLKGETPDRVPWFADLGHWYRSQSDEPWNLITISNCTKEVTDLHREVKAGWYVEVGALHTEYFEDGIERVRERKGDLCIEVIKTPVGEVRMERKWNGASWSWDIYKLMVETPDDLKVLLYAAERRNFRPMLSNWDLMEDMGGDIGLGFPSIGYTGLGSLISYFMGVENTIYAIYDEPELVQRYITTYNEKQLQLVKDIYAVSPAPHILFSDNVSADVQSPDLFRRFSYCHYKNIADIMHKAGKTVSAHLDGLLNNIIGIVAQTGVDVADACTPKPTGDLSPAEIRRQAGNNMVLMGGISPTAWLPQTREKDFVKHVQDWLELKKISNRLVQSAGDQVPPGTELKRIKLVYDIVEEYGRY